MKELKEWLEVKRNAALNSMAVNADNPVLKKFYEGISDTYMGVLIHLAVNDKTN